MIGLTGITMETADDPYWAKKITKDEADMAAHYSVCELSGLPDWFGALYNEFPKQVDAVVVNELRWELHENKPENNTLHTLSAIRYGENELKNHHKNTLFNLLSGKEPQNDFAIDHALTLVLDGDLDDGFRAHLAELAFKRFKTAVAENRKIT